MNTDPDKIENVRELPVKSRRKTDCFCAIFISIYVILLALILVFLYNQKTLNQLTYPTDNAGNLCGYTYPTYPYAYYTSTTDPTKRLCVNQCPKAGQTVLSCKPTPTLGCAANNSTMYRVQIYNSYLSQGRIGLICLPTDPALQQQVLTISHTRSKYEVFAVIDVIIMAMWISAILGPLFFLLFHFFPYKAVPWTIFIGGLSSIIFGILIIVLHQGFLLAKILLCIFFIWLGVISLQTLSSQDRRDALVVCSRLTHAAALTHGEQSDYHQLEISCANLAKLLKPLLLIITFALLYFLFFFICMHEGLAVWSVGHLVFKPDRLFYTVGGFGSTFLFVLLMVQLIWGAFFIKQAYNFIVGSHAVYWYFGKDGEPSYLERVEHLCRYHWGSVVGGSLLQGFFYFVDLIFDFFCSQDKPDKPVKDAYGNYMAKAYDDAIDYDRTVDTSNSHMCQDFFNLIRGQAISYVALTNQNYCNSARHCEFLSANSRFYDFSQVTNRMFRINAHILPMFIVLVISMAKMGPAGTPYSLLVIAILSFFIITYFVSYHPEKTQGLLISTYTDQALNDGQLQSAPRVMQITYLEDIQLNQTNIKICDILCKDSTFAIQ